MTIYTVEFQSMLTSDHSGAMYFVLTDSDTVLKPLPRPLTLTRIMGSGLFTRTTHLVRSREGHVSYKMDYSSKPFEGSTAWLRCVVMKRGVMFYNLTEKGTEPFQTSIGMARTWFPDIIRGRKTNPTYDIHLKVEESSAENRPEETQEEHPRERQGC
jgi:hypothetical protein